MQFAAMMMEEAKLGGLSALALSMPFDEATDLMGDTGRHGDKGRWGDMDMGRHGYGETWRPT